MLVEVLFWVFAAILAISALAMILVRNPVHSAMLLAIGDKYEAQIAAARGEDAPFR